MILFRKSISISIMIQFKSIIPNTANNYRQYHQGMANGKQITWKIKSLFRNKLHNSVRPAQFNVWTFAVVIMIA